jgi:hypothetical protein
MTRTLLLLLFILNCFTSTLLAKSERQSQTDLLVYSINGKGVFCFNTITSKNSELAIIKRNFLSETLKAINDTIVIITSRSKIKAGNEFVKNKLYKQGTDGAVGTYEPTVNFTDTVFAININNSTFFISKVIQNKLIHWNLYQTIRVYKQNGKIDSNYSNVVKVDFYNQDSDSFTYNQNMFLLDNCYSESNVVNGFKVVSFSGDLYFVHEGEIKQITNENYRFEPKEYNFGYYAPTISADGRRISFQIMSKIRPNHTGIFEFNRDTYKTIKLTNLGYVTPRYSYSGNFIACGKDSTTLWNLFNVNEIYIINLQTKILQKIGVGNSYLWMK